MRFKSRRTRLRPGEKMKILPGGGGAPLSPEGPIDIQAGVTKDGLVTIDASKAFQSLTLAPDCALGLAGVIVGAAAKARPTPCLAEVTTTKDGAVIIDFNVPLKSMRLSTDEARAFAQHLMSVVNAESWRAAASPPP